MEQEKLDVLYKSLLDMDMSTLPKIIVETKDENKRNFLVTVYNFFLKIKQKEIITSGKF